MSKLLAYAVAGGLLLVILAGIAYTIYNKGSELERSKQEKENATFTINAQHGRSTYDQCDLADGMYDFVKGTCKLPAAQPSPRTTPGG